MHKIIFILFIYLFSSISLYSQNTLAGAKNLGTFVTTSGKSDVLDTRNFTNDYAGTSANDVYYKFRILNMMEATISHCGSEVKDTYLHLLNSSGERIAYNDDYFGEGGCVGRSSQAVIKMILKPGIYYIVSEGYNSSFNGKIQTNVEFVKVPDCYPATNLGVLDGSFEKKFTGNSDNSRNYSIGLNTKQLFYKFTLNRSMEVTISHCGSALEDTYLLLLNKSGSVIATYDRYTGPAGNCSQEEQAFMKRILTAGTYFVVSQGKSKNGYITTSISGDASPSIFPSIDIGEKKNSFEYSNTRNTSLYQNCYNGKYSYSPVDAKDIIYKFALSRAMTVTISQCGTELEESNLYVLNSMGNLLVSMAYNYSDHCRDNIIQDLSAGTYYVISEANAEDGYITTSIKGTFSQYNYITPDEGRNYIHTQTYLIDQPYDYMEDIRYYDGLGRCIQENQVWGGSKREDLVACIEYDDLGFESKVWRPLSISDNNGALYKGDRIEDAKKDSYKDEYDYSEYMYENSPLHELTTKYGPGSDWRKGNGSSSKIEYLTNSSSYPCNYYYVSGDNLVKNNTYSNNSLNVTKYVNEDNHVSYEFKDKLGRIILSRQMDSDIKHDTYYVYDYFGNLRFVLPPMASDGLSSNTTYSSNNNYIRDYAYTYQYDSRGRCIEKKMPGRNTEPVYFVYDKSDRLIFSQDGEQRASYSGEWTFYKYDKQGRIIMKGVCELASNTTVAALRTKLQDHVITAIFDENNFPFGYKEIIHPDISCSRLEIRKVNYYDDYRFRKLIAFGTDFEYQRQQKGFSNKRYGTDDDRVAVKGLLTGVLDISDEMDVIGTVYYYDRNGNIIQTIANSHLGGFHKEYINYSFTNKPVKKISIHSIGTDLIKEIYTYSYDHRDRLTTTLYSLNDAADITMSDITYNKNGQIKSKSLYGDTETIKYEFNIRNQLTKMYSKNFNHQLSYQEEIVNTTPSFSGNISQVTWKTPRKVKQQYYHYSYDALNRLTKSTYREGSISGYDYSKNYTEEMFFDKMGNITQLKRHKAEFEYMDNLTLAYTGNQLTKAVEEGDATAGFLKPGGTLPVKEYDYNKNGSLLYDYHSGISAIAYNALNLPSKIQFRSGNMVNYVYDASGKKLRTTHTVGRGTMNIPLGTFVPLTGSVIGYSLVTDYSRNIIYEDGSLKYILTPEGFITKDHSSGSIYTHHYYLKDYLGNNRVVVALADSTYIAQETEYYPFGMPYADGIGAGYQPFKFGGKELDEMYGLNWYDQGARSFGSIVPRTPTLDPLAEKYYHISPYVQWANNPVKYVDPDGKDVLVKDIGEGKYEIVGGTANNDLNIYMVDKEGIRTGFTLGETLTSHSFHNEDGNAITGAIIDINDTSGDNFLKNEIFAVDWGLVDYAWNARSGKILDFKTRGIKAELNVVAQKRYHYRGMPITAIPQRRGKKGSVFASARDFGNIAAGYVAGVNGLTWDQARLGFDAYESWDRGKFKTEGLPSQKAQFEGFLFGSLKYHENIKK